MDKYSIFEEIGFTRAEKAVYLALLKLGKSKSGSIIKRTGLQSSVVHNALNALAEKGFVTHVLVGKIKEYCALDPKTISNHLLSKKQEYDRLLPELASLQTGAFTVAEVYEGYGGLMAAMLDMIQDGRKGDVYKYFAAEEKYLSDEAKSFFAKVDALRREKGIIVRGIAERKNRRLLRYRASDLRFTSQRIPPAMNIFKEDILFITLADRPVAIRIRSKELSAKYHQLWDGFWRTR